ncbi:hypothetical protein DTQ70_13550 [Runella sp. SP2]|nr:hypothetical protein DTQ70_13550 [Runella sp. SP2]
MLRGAHTPPDKTPSKFRLLTKQTRKIAKKDFPQDATWKVFFVSMDKVTNNSTFQDHAIFPQKYSIGLCVAFIASTKFFSES